MVEIPSLHPRKNVVKKELTDKLTQLTGLDFDFVVNDDVIFIPRRFCASATSVVVVLAVRSTCKRAGCRRCDHLFFITVRYLRKGETRYDADERVLTVIIRKIITNTYNLDTTDNAVQTWTQRKARTRCRT